MPRELDTKNQTRREFVVELRHAEYMATGSGWYKWHGILCLAWAGWVAYFQSFAVSPSFRVMSSVAPEEVFAVILAVVGMYTLFAAASARPKDLLVASALNCLVWAGISGLFAAAAVASTGVVAYAWMSFGHALFFGQMVTRMLRARHLEREGHSD